MYQIKLITTLEELSKLEEEWNYLLTQTPSKTVFQTFEWSFTWWCAVGSYNSGAELHVLAVREDGEPRAIVPLMIQNKSSHRVLTFLSAPYADYHDIIFKQTSKYQTLAEIMEYLAAEHEIWDQIDLDEIPEVSSLLMYYRQVQKKAPCSRLTLQTGTICPRLYLTNDALFAKSANRKEYLIKIRRLSRLGQLKCYHHFSPESIRSRLPLFKAMHRKEWNNHSNTIGPFEDPDVARFFSKLVDSMSPRGWVMLTELVLDAWPIAYYFSFAYERTYWAYRTCFETELARYSPGHVMLRYILHYLKQEGYAVFDFMRGGYGYKYCYADSEQVNYRISSK
jgi:CelD/BcsL family acetyltransferase involved in cellulose biosynthesis